MRSKNNAPRSAVCVLSLLLACGGDGPADTAAFVPVVESGTGETDIAGSTLAQDTDPATTTVGNEDETASSVTSGAAATTLIATDDASVGSSGDSESSSGSAIEPPPGLSCDEPFEYAGHQGCLSQVAGLDVKFFPLDQPAPVQRLVVYLHGDGGHEWFQNWGFSPEILEWAKPQDFLVLGIKSPTGYNGSTEPAYGAAQPIHADMVATTLESFLEAYTVVEERNLYWGASGGSWFISSSYIPVAGKRVPGIFVANCGGSGVSFGWEWDPASDPATVALNSIYFNYGDQDFLAQRSADSLDQYAALGFVTDQLIHPGATHCDHPIAGPTLDFWMGEL